MKGQALVTPAAVCCMLSCLGLGLSAGELTAYSLVTRDGS